VKFIIVQDGVLNKGGAGSGNFGHSGREGLVGGSDDDNEATGNTHSNDIDMVGNHLNFRTMGERGMFPVVPQFKNQIYVGADVDFYDSEGEKKTGKIFFLHGDKIRIKDLDGKIHKQELRDWKTANKVWITPGVQ
jgi:hypothetical protein